MSMSYNAILEAIEKTGDTSILSLFNSIICSDKDSISEFRQDQFYNTGDKVYIYRDEYPYHFFYECKRDRVYGEFNPKYWVNLSVDPRISNKDSRCIGDIHLIKRVPDGSKRYVLDELDPSIEREFMIFSGSDLVDSETYLISNNNTITFLGQISQYAKLTFLAFDVRGIEKYNYHKEYAAQMTAISGRYVAINDKILPDDRFIVMTKNGVLDESYYKVYREEGQIAINSLGINSTITVHHFSYRDYESMATTHNVIHDRISIDSTTNSFSIGVNNWDLTNDSILIFSKNLGPIPVRDVMYNNKVITLKDQTLIGGDIIEVFAFLKDRRKEKSKVSMSDLSESVVKSIDKLTTADFIFAQGDEEREISLSDLNLKGEFSITPTILSSSGGDVSFSFLNINTDSVTVKYTGLADSVKVVFEIKTR